VRELDARVAAVIRVDAVWLAVDALDMRSGTESALARVVNVFGSARPHHAYLFANRRTNRMKVLVPTQPANRIQELLPHHWKLSRAPL
jgi:hypothetical protein